jgi:hypothetical protein
MRGAARVAIAAGAALQTLALIVGAATAAKKKKAVEVADSATLQGQPNSDGPFDSTTVTTRCPKGKLAFGGWSAEVDFGSGPGGDIRAPARLEARVVGHGGEWQRRRRGPDLDRVLPQDQEAEADQQHHHARAARRGRRQRDGHHDRDLPLQREASDLAASWASSTPPTSIRPSSPRR